MAGDADILTAGDKNTFVRDGVLIRRGAVACDLVRRARARIDDWYRTGLDADAIATYTQTTFAPDLGTDPQLLDLYRASGLQRLAGALVHPDHLTPATSAQIQIRLPAAHLEQVQPNKGMHVDGVACPHLDPAELRTFTLLVGVLLSEVISTASGPLRFLPGGHHRMAEWFHTRWSPGTAEQVPPELAAQAGTPLLGQAGDAIVMHHLVPHAVGTNHTNAPRVMAYFRLKHQHHGDQRLHALRDPWREFPSLATHTGDTGQAQ